MRVYLTGPITGHSDKEIENWRTAMARRLKPIAEVVDPAAYSYDSAQTFRMGETPDAAVTRLHHGQFVIERNKKLICDSDVVLANFLGAGARASIGSVGELFWANAFGKPIVLVREAQGNVHDHAMVNAIASIVCTSLDEAVAAIGEMAGRRPSRKQAGRS
jgi:nucleoside 2-deoxyribosyltransferase